MKRGRSVEKDIGRTLHVYNQAAGGDNFEAMLELGKEMAEGRDGTEQDVGRAAELHSRAID